MPLIPLCRSAAAEVPVPPRGQLEPTDLDEIVDLIIARLNAIRSKLAPGKIGQLLDEAIGLALHTWIVSGHLKDAIREALENAIEKDMDAQ